jgi:hypothetical protein
VAALAQLTAFVAHAGGFVEVAVILGVIALALLVWLYGRTSDDEGDGEPPARRDSRGEGLR